VGFLRDETDNIRLEAGTVEATESLIIERLAIFAAPTCSVRQA